MDFLSLPSAPALVRGPWSLVLVHRVFSGLGNEVRPGLMGSIPGPGPHCTLTPSRGPRATLRLRSGLSSP